MHHLAKQQIESLKAASAASPPPSDENTTGQKAPPSEGIEDGSMDGIPMELLENRAMQTFLADNNSTLVSSSGHEREHRRTPRSLIRKTQPDDGDDAPAIPKRNRRSSGTRSSSIVSVDDVRNLCDAEFRSSAMENPTGELPRFSMEEVTLGERLGQGAFGFVMEIRALCVDSSSTSLPHKSHNEKNHNAQWSDSEDDGETALQAKEQLQQTRKFLAQHCIRPNGQARFVIKQLRSEIMSESSRKLQGISDLARETFFLKRIRHPNIIRLRALSNESEYDNHYFIIMDRLQDTLPDLLEVWKKQRKQSNGRFGLFRGRRGRSQNCPLKDNIVTVCFELSSAMAHLHRHDILYRDLKPANIGFDFKGNLRLFDFGLAKELPSTKNTNKSQQKERLYRLTHMCGTPRYMAPEVANGFLYGPSCDVYSFALLCWQMATLQRPYDGFVLNDLVQTVWAPPHTRPGIRKEWPPYFRDLLVRGWSERIQDRPTMYEIESMLAEQVGMFNESFDLANHLSPRRSTLSGAAEFEDLYNNTAALPF